MLGLLQGDGEQIRLEMKKWKHQSIQSILTDEKNHLLLLLQRIFGV